MTSIRRGILTGLTAVATFYFSFWIAGALLVAGVHGHEAAIGVASTAVAAVLAVLAARYIWRHAAVPGGLAASMLAGAVTTGAIGFCVGFFGPILLMPGANQGPLIGLLITGPLGILLGAIGGWVKWAARQAREAEPPV